MVNNTQLNASAVATATAKFYPRFAQLDAFNKGIARAMYKNSTYAHKPPLVDCYFSLDYSDNVSWIFWRNPNTP